ncbi:MAG TPA: hypothetical protein VE999_22695 [Gemmataceae bacterium]|nr:hypothetical protein [Gemmataceae bacterium]
MPMEVNVRSAFTWLLQTVCEALQPVIISLRTLEKVKRNEAADLLELTVARQPSLLGGFFTALDDIEPVHGDDISVS